MLKNSDIRAIFSSPSGQAVLLWILHEHRVFSKELKTQKDITLHNWGMKLLSLIGPRDTKRSVEGFIHMAQMCDNEKDLEDK